MPSLVDENADSHERETENERAEEDLQIMSPNTMPTPPPPEDTPTSPGSAASSRFSSTCTSPDLMKVAGTDSYTQDSSLEESPASSPNSSYFGEVKSAENQNEAKVSCSSMRSSEDEKCTSDQEMSEQELEQKVPKNIKLPQSES